MAEFNFDSLDISRVNNETIAELGEILWQYTSVHCQEDIDIAEKYRDSVDALPLPLLDIRPRRKVTKELTNLYRKATGQLVLK